MVHGFDVVGDGVGLTAGKSVVLSVGHAGRDYPVDIAKRLCVGIDSIITLEDRFADRLIERAVAQGHVAVVARVPRLIVDLNRAETDIDPLAHSGVRGDGPVSAKARGGLGLVPTRLHGIGTLWREPLDAGELAERIATWHRPYHHAVADLLDSARRAHGRALLIDVHSMPPLAGPRPVQIVIGSRHGTTAHPATVAAALAWWRRQRFHVVAEVPYAGGHTIARHANLAGGIEAVQLEIDRRLYLEPRLRAVGTGLVAMQRLIADFAESMKGAIIPLAFAAE